MTKSNLQKDNKICVGVITSVNGVRGQVKIRSFTETPVDIANFNNVVDEEGISYNINSVLAKKDYIIAGIEGVKTRNEAETLRNKKVFIDRSELPELHSDEFYHADLVGMEVRNLDGMTIGFIKNVVNFGAGDILEISDISNDKSTYYPFKKQFVPEVDLVKGFVVVDFQEEIIASIAGE
jgi:16S rRNA processing protein RimM